MRHRPSHTHGRESGFGLFELIAALVISAIVLVVIFSTFFRTLGFSGRVTSTVESRQHARLALQLLERDIRMAGSGWGRSRVDGSWNGNPVVYYGLIPGYGGVGQSDSLQMMGAWSATTSLRNALPTPSSTLRIYEVTGFAVNDLVVVTDGSSAHLFQVTQITGSTGPGILGHNVSSPYNQVEGFANWPASGYGIGAQVLRVDRVSYRFDPTDHRRPCLLRQENGHPPQVAAWNVDRFTMSYLLQDGTITRDPDTVTVIDRVIPNIVTHVTNNAQDSLQAEIRPRAF
jgi:type II secretory pathway pseudopilin PulG